MNTSTDRIERQIHIKAPRSKVWSSLADAESFGNWFGVALKGKRFVAGEPIEGNITYPGYEHVVWKVVVERIEPERLLSFRWHPYAVDPHVDYSHEPTTLVSFELEETRDGTLLRLVESGFDQIPTHRRLEAFRMNSQGWDAQMKNIDAYVASH
ncbi:SRPBCC family protein [Dyella psychrodurans]|uniref:Vanillate O-demethylase oxidoreductase VanB n=1 Tax=Dyella psychrodurans TaxID=1927960 RepID=A0A370WWB7_9GAMM|nr:SRPBCC family protein [Dyella psychrodurans]RDS80351.1 vanillate O-demethylase oxidoreductase VanB [Dyella psychrodurans]